MTNTIQINENFTEIATKTIDDRKRISISEAMDSVLTGISRFKIFRGEDGDFLLRPVVEIPVQEVWLYKNKTALKMVRKGIQESSQGKAKKLDMSLLEA
jgi:hypothetical protein